MGREKQNGREGVAKSRATSAATPGDVTGQWRYVAPIVTVLRELGGSAAPREVTDRVIERLRISEAEQNETTTNGQSRVRNQIAWARNSLADAGLIDRSIRGVWTLTDEGRRVTDLGVRDMKRRIFGTGPTSGTAEADGRSSEVGDDARPMERYRDRLLEIIRGLPPSGFEHLCRRLLLESVFQTVEVTGRSNDGGIDGHGILEINPFVTFKVLFQCKRYRAGSTVAPTQVRDFRGAMQGRADKGLILTTGAFSVEAKREATRDGAPPIELVDGEKLVDMFKLAKLGLKEIMTYEVIESFFDDFRDRLAPTP